MLRLEGEASAGITVGDLVAVLVEADVVAAGAVSKMEADGPVATLDFLEWALPPRGEAWVIPRNLPENLEARLPPLVVRRARADRAPGEDRSNGPNPAGPDRPERPAVVRAFVSAVDPDASGSTVRLDNPAASRLAIGDRLDVYRGGRYVGFAQVVSIEGPEAEAEVLTSLSASAMQAGDLAVRRAPAGSSQIRQGFVFRVEGDYALVSLGEADGVRRGDRLFTRDGTGDDRRLTVVRVYPDHCGASLEGGGTDSEVGLVMWQPAHTSEGCAAFVELAASGARSAGVPWLMRVPSGSASLPLRTGDFVLTGDRRRNVGVVLTNSEWGAYVYVPGVWTVPEGARDGDRSAE
ncbi:MAG TPA: hypothetical protein VM243_04120 [Phycisphaerae bacterium]|nr:hypothetical protein [Phycisphaerae bacterium]